MKRIRINEGKVGLVFRRGDFYRVITAGKHTLGFADKLLVYNMNTEFAAPVNLNILLRNEVLASLVTVIDVKDNEIALHYEDGKPCQIKQSGKYTFWNGLIEHTYLKVDTNDARIEPDVLEQMLQFRESVQFMRISKVESNERGLLFIDEVFVEEIGPGLYHFWKNLQTVTIRKVDLRQRQLEVSGQEILTRDKAALRINFSLHFRVTDLQKALVLSADYEKQLYMLCQMALREFIGTLTMDELLGRKDNVSDFVMKEVGAQAESLGVKLIASGIKDVILPGEMKEIMNQVLIAEKRAQANTVLRREETASTRSLLNTAKLMEDNAMLFKLKEMEYVEKIADKINNISLSGGNQVVDQLKEIFSRS